MHPSMSQALASRPLNCRSLREVYWPSLLGFQMHPTACQLGIEGNRASVAVDVFVFARQPEDQRKTVWEKLEVPEYRPPCVIE